MAISIFRLGIIIIRSDRRNNMENDKQIITSNSNKYISPQPLKNNGIVEEDQNESQLEAQQKLHPSNKQISINNQQVVQSNITEQTTNIANTQNSKNIEENTIKQEQGQIKNHLANQCLQASPQKAIQSSPYKIYQKKNHLTNKKIQQRTHQTKAIDNQIQQLQTNVSKNKLLKEIFTHFCKQNNLSSIKSTFFSEKNKTIEEMSLNKWMVFCKQFQINQRLCSLKVALKRRSLRQSDIKLESSQVREQIRMKQMKQINIILTNIFHKAAQHLSKMTYPQFSIAIRLLYEQFKLFNEANFPITEEEFIKKHLFCNDQVECFNKLSNLKFTTGIAKINYYKNPPLHVGNRQIYPITNKQNNQGLKKSLSVVTHQHSNMALHSIIKDAKSTLAQVAQVGSQSIRNASKRVSKLQLQEIKKKPKKKVEKKGLYDYFDSTHDDILESYFEAQKMVKAGSYSLQ